MMDFEQGTRSRQLAAQLQTFMDDHVYPNEAVYAAQLHEDPAVQFRVPPILEELKADRPPPSGPRGLLVH